MYWMFVCFFTQNLKFTVYSISSHSALHKYCNNLIRKWICLICINKRCRRLLRVQPPQEGREVGVLIPFPRELFFFKSQLKSHNPSLCWSNWNPFPIFLLFFLESQSQCTKSHFPDSETGKSQLPFYPFTTLPQVNNKCLILFWRYQILLCLTPADFTRQRETP